MKKSSKATKNPFSRLSLWPRVLRDVSKINLQTTVMNQQLAFPLAVAPAGFQRLLHDDGEAGVAAAARDAGVPYVMSTMSVSTMESVAAQVPDAIKWFQLYVFKNRQVSENLVRRAEKAGFEALVLTVDAPLLGNRISTGKTPLKCPFKLENLAAALPVGTAQDKPTLDKAKAVIEDALTWTDIEWLRSITKLPLILKGQLKTLFYCKQSSSQTCFSLCWPF